MYDIVWPESTPAAVAASAFDLLGHVLDVHEHGKLLFPGHGSPGSSLYDSGALWWQLLGSSKVGTLFNKEEQIFSIPNSTLAGFEGLRQFLPSDVCDVFSTWLATDRCNLTLGFYGPDHNMILHKDGAAPSLASGLGPPAAKVILNLCGTLPFAVSPVQDSMAYGSYLQRNEGCGLVLARYRSYTNSTVVSELGQRGADVFHAAGSGEQGGITMIAEFREDPRDPKYDVRKDIAAGGLVRIKERAA